MFLFYSALSIASCTAFLNASDDIVAPDTDSTSAVFSSIIFYVNSSRATSPTLSVSVDSLSISVILSPSIVTVTLIGPA